MASPWHQNKVSTVGICIVMSSTFAVLILDADMYKLGIHKYLSDLCISSQMDSGAENVSMLGRHQALKRPPISISKQ